MKARMIVMQGLSETEKNGELKILFKALRNRKFEEVKALINDNPELIDACLPGGIYPLKEAIENGDEDLAILLIIKGADIRRQDDRFNTPLHHAAFYGQLKVCDMLIRKEADVNALNIEGQTPLNMLFSNSVGEARRLELEKLIRYHGGRI